MFQKKQFRDARAAFISYLEIHGLKGSQRNRLIVVFDGKEDVFSPRIDCSFEVIFTRGESADEKIKEIVAASSQPKNMIVVTDDKGIISFVRQLGAGIKSVSEFMKKPKAIKPSARGLRQDVKIDLNIVLRDAITEELKGIWLKEKRSS